MIGRLGKGGGPMGGELPVVSAGERATGSAWRWQWHGGANALVLAWLAASAGLAGASAIGLPAVPAWLGIHTLLLGGATTAIVVWSEHFAVAVLHAPIPDRRWSATRLGILTAGQLSVVIGVIAEVTWLLGAGATLVAVAIAAHGISLWRLRRGALGGRLSGVVNFYLVACGALLAGAVLGGMLGTGLAAQEPWHSRVHLAHLHLNLGGWVLLTVLGTMFMLLPTTLRTLMEPSTERAMRLTLWLAGPGLAVAVAGLLMGSRWVASAGVSAYAAGAVVAVATFATTLGRKRPNNGSAWMLTAATVWLLAAVFVDLAVLAFAWSVHAEPLAVIGPVLLIGVVAQVLIGSLTFLLPVVLGSGPAAAKQGAARLDGWWPVRFTLLNGAVAVLTVAGALDQSGLRRIGWLMVAVAGADFLVRAVSLIAARLSERFAIGFGVAAGAAVTAIAVLFAVSTGPVTAPDDGHTHSHDDDHSATSAQARVVDVQLQGMRVSPPTLSVPLGSELTLRVSNLDSQPHDLRTGTGQRTALLKQGESTLLSLGRVTKEIKAWCTVAGHRAAGMGMTINVGAAASSPQETVQAYDPVLPAASPDTVHRIELPVVEKEIEVAAGVRQKMWTFGGSVPGPTLRGKVGDVFEVTLVNNGTLGHGIDFHAGALAPDGPMRTIQPGERLTYRFTADKAGVWMYHCSTAPLSQHIGGGMFGAVIIDPPDLAPVDREYLLVSSELYYGDAGSDSQVAGLNAGTPDGWAFNGIAGQYRQSPLAAKAGERVRFWLLNAGPGGLVAFHVVGVRFDTVYHEGSYTLRPGVGGAQTLALAASQGGFVETVFPEAGRYPFVDHDFRHAEGGAAGVVTVSER